MTIWVGQKDTCSDMVTLKLKLCAVLSNGVSVHLTWQHVPRAVDVSRTEL